MIKYTDLSLVKIHKHQAEGENQHETFKNICFFRVRACFAKGMKENNRLISCRLRISSRVHVCLGLLCALCSKYC